MDAGAQHRLGMVTEGSEWIHRLLVIGFWFLLLGLPAWLGFYLLTPALSNAPLAALFAVPFGPAMSAAYFAVNRGTTSEHSPTRDFWYALRLNLRESLAVWVPALAVGVLLSWGLVLGSGQVSAGFTSTAIWLAAGAVTVVTVAALVVGAVFAFRVRDVWRLAIAGLLLRPLAGFGIVAWLAVLVVVVLMGHVWLAILGFVPSLCLLRRLVRPLQRWVREYHVADPDEPDDDDSGRGDVL